MRIFARTMAVCGILLRKIFCDITRCHPHGRGKTRLPELYSTAMPVWIRNSLFAVVMLCAAVIGMRVYLELNRPVAPEPDLPVSGQVSGAPERLPHFVLNDIAGEPRNIHEWSGPLLLNFWATWCAPCRREIPLLQALHADRAGIQVIGIAIDRQTDVESFLGEYGVTYPNLVGQEDALEVSELFGLAGLGLPFSVLTGADGHVLTVHIGEIDAAQLAEMVGISKAYESGALPLAAARAKLAEI